jgi:4-hydroxybenzoate polyprenyltransferase
LIWVKQLRVHQWVKNLLLFVPAVTSFRILDQRLWPALSLAFVAFSFVASSIYIFNDLVDAPNDRNHPTKKDRPIASGKISFRKALTVGIGLLLVGLVVGFEAGTNFLLTLLAYLAVTFAYTFWLKRLVIVDCLTLAVLYTVRVLAGGVATNIELSFWLLAFSIFFFASLAWVKRYAELETSRAKGIEPVAGRGYQVTDQPLVLAFGAMSAFIAVLIFALYLNSDAIRVLYEVPQIGWLAIPLIMYLIARIWFKAHRGLMNEDPILFLIRDLPSLVTIALVGASLVLAHIGWN